MTITGDGHTPPAPAAPILDPGSDTPPVGDNLTTITSPVVTGTAGSTIRRVDVSVDGNRVGNALVSNGAWSFQLPTQ